MNDLQQYFQEFSAMVMNYIPQLAWALITLLLGLWVIRMLVKATDRLMKKRDTDASLRHFLKNLTSIGLKVLLVISVISMAGIETTSFIAVVGAAGLAIGLALQGSLANFAGGVLILLLKPFRVGDYIAGAGHSGTVEEIQIFYTVLKTPQNQKIVIPNGNLSNSAVTNYSAEPTRRLDQTYGISYEDDIDKAREILQGLINKDERTLQEPAPQILVDSLGDNAVNMKIRVWTNSDDFWNLHFDMQEKVKKAFTNEGISIPFPQRDVHLYQKS